MRGPVFSKIIENFELESFDVCVNLLTCSISSIDSALLPQEIDDGKLEVVGLYSSFHIAQLQIGLSEPYYIGQGSEVKVLYSVNFFRFKEISLKFVIIIFSSKIILHEKLPIQADGEPWIQKPAEIKISFCNQAKVLKVQ